MKLKINKLPKPVIKNLRNQSSVIHTKSCSRQMLEKFTEGFLELDSQFKIVYCSREVADLLIRDVSDIVGLHFWRLTSEVANLKWLAQFELDLIENHTFRAKHFFPESDRWLSVTINLAPNATSVYLHDVTNEEKSREQLSKEKKQFMQFFSCSPIPQWVYDIDTLKFLDVNAAAVSEYGYTHEEFLQMTIKDLRPVKDVHELQHVLNNEAEMGLNHLANVNHVQKNGEIKQVRVEGNSVDYLGKNARLVLAIDCTKRYLAQEALEKSEHRFKSLVQNGSELIAILDDSWNYKYVNESSTAILGIDSQELIGKSSFDLIHPDDKDLVFGQLLALNEQKQLKLLPFRFSNGSKKYRWIEAIVTDMRDEPSICGIVINSRDITENVVNKIKTLKSIERFDIVSKATSDTIWDWDIKSGKIIWNKGIKGIFGHKKIIYTVDWFLDQVHPEDVHQNVIQEYKNTLEQGKSRLTRQYRFKCADGSYKTILDRSFIIFDAAKKPVRMIGSMQDITHKINYITAIEQQNKKLQEISWLQSHAVRAPLASILGLTQLVADKDLNATDRQQLFSYLETSAKQLDSVIANIVATANE